MNTEEIEKRIKSLESSWDLHETIIQTERIEQNEKYKQIDRIVRVVYQLKSEMTYLHNEVYELQKLQGLHGEVPKKKHTGDTL